MQLVNGAKLKKTLQRTLDIYPASTEISKTSFNRKLFYINKFKCRNFC